MQVELINHSPQPIETLYAAYRTCYSKDTPSEIWQKIRSGSITKEKMVKFIQERLATGHNSPLEQVKFWFAISGVSRSLSHQLVRHRIGISFAQQSQRYVQYGGDVFTYILPDSWKGEMAVEFRELMQNISKLYERALKAGIPTEDARFVLPNATTTNFQIEVNLAELLHIGDLRLCTRAQWEIRRMVSLMKSEVKKALPLFGSYIQPKCGEKRMGICDESLSDWEKCPIGRKRPHKSQCVN